MIQNDQLNPNNRFLIILNKFGIQDGYWEELRDNNGVPQNCHCSSEIYFRLRDSASTSITTKRSIFIFIYKINVEKKKSNGWCSLVKTFKNIDVSPVCNGNDGNGIV